MSTFPIAPINGEIATVANVAYQYNTSTNAWRRVIGNISTLSVAGNTSTGNLLTGGYVTATGNITGSYIIGNGSQLTGLPAGYSNANVVAYGQAGWAGNIIPSSNAVYSLGTAALQWKSLYVSNTTVYIGNVALSTDGNVLTVAGNTVITTTSGNLYVSGMISATGNIQGNYILGNGSQLTGLPEQYGNANVGAYLPTYTGNLTAGNISATGNITGAYIIGNGSQLTGLPAGYANSNAASYFASGNVTTDILTTGNVTGAYIVGNGSALTNITGANVSGTVANATYATSAGTAGTVTTAAQSNITSVGTLTAVTVTGNATAGNILTSGIVSATGTITGNTLLAGGLSLTGNAITSPGPTITIDPNGAGGTDGNVVITGNLTVQGTTTTINSNTISTNDLTINMANNAANATAANNGGIEVGPVGAPYATLLYNTAANVWVASLGISSSGNVTGTNLLTGGLISATGNVNTGNVLTGGLISATGNAAVGNLLTAGSISATGNATVGGIATAGSIFVTGVPAFNSVTIAGATVSAAGNITGGNLSVGTGTVTLGNIVNANGNGVGNIGSSSLYFNTVFAKATSAQYADLAEKYTADAEYAPGTVVSFGGDAEVTQSGTDADRRVAGVVSTNPSYIMNGGLDGANVVTVALTGRVPTKVTGQVRKGDLMVSNGDGTARAEADPKAGAIIGKALENFNGATGVIEVVIGRF